MKSKPLGHSHQLVRLPLEVLPSSALALQPLQELAARIKSTHEQCLASPTTALLLARNAGEWLLEAAEQIPPSEWLSWVATYCNISEKTAETYMQIARGWPRLRPAVAVTAREAEAAETTSAIPFGIASPRTDAAPTLHALIPPAEPDIIEVEFHPVSPAEEQAKETIAAEILPPEPLVSNKGDRAALDVLTFFIPGNVVPKARPRVTSNGTFLPRRYREWRNRAEVEISRQLFERSPYPTLPIPRAAIKVRLVGKHRMNADSDNIVGSCLDALVAVGVLKNDCLSYIPEIAFKFVPQGTQGVHIKVYSLSPIENSQQ